MTMTIDIFIDPVCPWCYIGKKHLGIALETYTRSLGAIQIIWRIFQINPDMPKAGMDYQVYLQKKFANNVAIAQSHERIKLASERVNLNLDLSGIRKMPNTMKAHRLVRWASLHNKADQLVKNLFQAYLGKGVDIGNTNELAFIASICGLDRDDATAFLQDRFFDSELRQEESDAREAGVPGVPFFLIDQQYMLSGVQPPVVFHHIFDLVLDGDNKS